MAWGQPVDVRRVGTVGDDLADSSVAGYLAKYATKSTEVTGHCSTRLTPNTIDGYSDPEGNHLARLIDACWRLGRPTHISAASGAATAGNRQGHLDAKPNPYSGLRRWAHMLGFGGHFLTKARRYSVTLGLLRDTRATYRRTENNTADTITIGTFAGSGWLTDGDALLANTAAARRRTVGRIGREELAYQEWLTGAAA